MLKQRMCAQDVVVRLNDPVQIVAANVVQIHAVQHHSCLRVLKQGMCARDGVVRLNDRKIHEVPGT